MVTRAAYGETALEIAAATASAATASAATAVKNNCNGSSSETVSR